MKVIKITTQAELDALPESFDEFTVIEIRSKERISVVARGNSSVVARENSSVAAWGNSSVVARGNSSVAAWENSSVVARGNSSVVARENSSVAAWENSSVVAWENSSVVARGNVAIRLYSAAAITLFAFSACWICRPNDCTPKKKSKTATIIEVVEEPGVDGWLDREGIEKQDATVTLFKRVSKDWQTQEGCANETTWTIGAEMLVPNWDPSIECGPGKFHACGRPYFCDEFRSRLDDRYIAIEVKVEDLYVHNCPDYPHKVAFRAGRVLHECDRFGKKLEVLP